MSNSAEHNEVENSTHESVLQIISEFSEVFTFVRTHWHELTADLHPELTRGTVPTLLAISRHGPITATELANHLTADKTIVSKQVGQLKRLGLLNTDACDEDRRITYLSVSPLAQQRIDEVRDVIAERYRERFAGWSDGEIDDLRDTLHRFNHAG